MYLNASHGADRRCHRTFFWDHISGLPSFALRCGRGPVCDLESRDAFGRRSGDVGCSLAALVRSGVLARWPLVGQVILGRRDLGSDAAREAWTPGGIRSSVAYLLPGRLAGPRLLVGSFGDAGCLLDGPHAIVRDLLVGQKDKIDFSILKSLEKRLLILLRNLLVSLIFSFTSLLFVIFLWAPNAN